MTVKVSDISAFAKHGFIDGYIELPDGRLESVEKIDGVDLSEVEFSPLYLPIVSADPEIQARYEAMRLDGQSHNIADMLAHRKFAGVKSDAIFNEGRWSGDGGKVGPEQIWLKEQAALHGVSTTGKWYSKGLASYPGDPTAWVDTRSDVLRVAREKNLTVHGYVEHEGHEVDHGGDVQIAADMISGEVDEVMSEFPHEDRERVTQEIFDLRTGRVDPNPLRVDDREVGENA